MKTTSKASKTYKEFSALHLCLFSRLCSPLSSLFCSPLSSSLWSPLYYLFRLIGSKHYQKNCASHAVAQEVVHLLCNMTSFLSATRLNSCAVFYIWRLNYSFAKGCIVNPIPIGGGKFVERKGGGVPFSNPIETGSNYHLPLKNDDPSRWGFRYHHC